MEGGMDGGREGGRKRGREGRKGKGGAEAGRTSGFLRSAPGSATPLKAEATQAAMAFIMSSLLGSGAGASPPPDDEAFAFPSDPFD